MLQYHSACTRHHHAHVTGASKARGATPVVAEASEVSKVACVI